MHLPGLYPLRFEPVFRRYLWGGRRLASELGKEIGQQSCAESWEVVDRPEVNSVVSVGRLAGTTLHEVIETYGKELLGASVHQQIHRPELPSRLRGRFPLLLKFLDANRTLSVQVHPDDQAGLKLDQPDLGKTEAWYVMDAAPGSKIYCGLRKGVDRESLARAVVDKTTDQALHVFEPKRGDCVFVPAGAVHAIGEGLLIAEIQQSSDTTFRLFDWNRVDQEGNHRDLHIEQALDVADYQLGPVDPRPPKTLDDDRVCELISCDKFVMRQWQLQNDSVEIPLCDTFRLLMVIEGEIELGSDPANRPLTKGQSMLVPANSECVSIASTSNGEFLEISVPSRI